MENDKISVIVPIYNIDRYVGICIESIIRQTYKNLEIILVDDGSQDRSPEICDLYAEKDSRIRVIHKVNGGLVSARKAGLAIATGEYASYVDGDDWIDSHFYDSLYAAIGNADLAIAGYSRDLFSASSHIFSNIPEGIYEGERLESLRKNMLSYGNFFRLGINTYVWNKLFKRELLLKYQNSVDNGISIGEDAAVVYPYVMECKKICIIDNCDYHYRQREDSMLKKSASFSKEAIGLRKLYTYLVEFANKYPSEYRLKEQVDDYILGICVMRSGGILDEEYLPYNKSFRGKRVIIWSAGTFGQQLINRIKESDYCTVAGWVDTDYWEYRRCCLNVDAVDVIDNIDFDYLVLATVDSNMAEEMKEKFAWRGVDANKILMVCCPKEKREQWIKKYLSL